VGEIGLDFYWSNDFRAEQMEAFKRQIELALQHNLPIAVHTRSAWSEMCEVIERFRGRGLRGVFHAYASDVDMARRLLRNGEFAFGIGGVVTFKNGGLDRVVADMPLEVLLLETDSPYLTPVPHRGKRNEPSYVRYVCEKIALLHNTTPDRVDAITTSTTKDIFCI
jgi:TatD DNase family protein